MGSHKVCVLFLCVAVTTAEVILKLSDCRMALWGKYSSFPHEALFTAYEKSLDLMFFAKKASNQGNNATHLAKLITSGTMRSAGLQSGASNPVLLE